MKLAKAHLPIKRCSGPCDDSHWQCTPLWIKRPLALYFSYSSRVKRVKPQFFETWIFWRPGILNLARRRASCAVLTLESRQRSDTLRLAKRTTHTRLQTIGACARQHLVNTEHL